MMKNFILPVILSLFLQASHAQTTVTIQSNGSDCYDSYVNSGSSGTNYGTDTRLRCGRSAGPTAVYRSFVAFNVSALPSNAIITNATLTLYGQTFSGDNKVYVTRVPSTWNQASINWSNQPSVSASDHPLSSASLQNDVIHVLTDVRQFVAEQCLNFGWQIRHQTESTNAARDYYSSDYSDPSKRPKLVITYVLPMQLSAYTVNHASVSANDGSIDITISEGESPYSYSWTGPNSFTSSSEDISGLEEGVYYLNVTDNNSSYYDYFIIGKECSTTEVIIQPDAFYGKDVLVASNSVSSCSVGSSGDINIYSTYNFQDDYTRAYIHFSTKGLTSDFVIDDATLRLYSASSSVTHFNTYEDNTSELCRVTSFWEERHLSEDNEPTFTTTDAVTIPNSTSPSQIYDLDIKTLIEYFRDNPTENYGFVMKLEDEDWNDGNNSYKQMSFNSSDHSSTSERPKLTLTYTLGCSSNAELTRKIDGSYTHTFLGKLYFNYREEYLDGELTYNVYDMTNTIVASDATETLNVDFGLNPFTLDFTSSGTCLAEGYYLLEVINSKKEKFYLRFKQISSDC